VIGLSRLVSLQTIPLSLIDNGWRALYKLRLSVGVGLGARPNGTGRRIKPAGLRALFVFMLVAMCPRALRVAAQSGSLVVTGPSPWTDVTAVPYGARCDGHTDDTAAFQLALSNFNFLGYGKLFVPYTGNPCYIKGFNTSLELAPLGNVTGFSYSSPSLTITFSSGFQLPQWLFNFGVGAPATIYGVTAVSGYNTFWTVTSVSGGSTPSIVLNNTYPTTIGSGTPTLTNATSASVCGPMPSFPSRASAPQGSREAVVQALPRSRRTRW
jgi:hypothetical protein